jgi:hypothetical protein
LIKVTVGVIVLSLMVVLGGSPAWGGEAVPLNDAQLDQVYGGEDPGDVVVIAMPEACVGTCSQNIGTDAFSGASAMIIVNSVASVVNAQLNVIVNNGNGNPTQTNVGFSTIGQ